MSEDPWAGIDCPKGVGQVNGNRVDVAHPWNFFWARDDEGSLLLTLRHAGSAQPVGPLPSLRGIEVALRPVGDLDERLLILKLCDTVNKEIFYRLCLDIIEATESAPSEKDAVGIAVQRTWRWHYLLSTGRDAKLTIGEQKGLIGELLVLERFLIPMLPALDAVRCWVGPTGSPKDFEMGEVAIEAKARRGTAQPQVLISSEDQLDTAGVKSLFLHVADLANSPNHDTGISVQQYSKRIAKRLEESDFAALVHYEEMLQMAGLRPEDSYEDQLWVEGTTRIYEVTESFPKITPRQLSPGVLSVKYSIDLSALSDFEIEGERLEELMREIING
jgi:hypothetical protein